MYKILYSTSKIFVNFLLLVKSSGLVDSTFEISNSRFLGRISVTLYLNFDPLLK